MPLRDLRTEYQLKGLAEADLSPDPFEQFGHWLRDAMDGGIVEPNAMIVATAGGDGRPDARVMLLKAFDHRGFVFFTNYLSAKAAQLDANPRATLCFWWDRLERQVRIAGTVAKVARAETEEYFRTRPRGSQLGTWASRQSAPLTGRESLERELERVTKQYEGREVDAPPHWGGYRVDPEWIEFWQGRQNRLHDRLRYLREGEKWRVQRLSP